MAKVLHKTAKPATETQGPPDLVLVEKPPQPDPKKPAAAPARDQGTPRITTSHAWRDLHPARIWPD
jgi:hypothetical protein